MQGLFLLDLNGVRSCIKFAKTALIFEHSENLKLGSRLKHVPL